MVSHLAAVLLVSNHPDIVTMMDPYIVSNFHPGIVFPSNMQTTMNIYTHVTETKAKKVQDSFAKFMDF